MSVRKCFRLGISSVSLAVAGALASTAVQAGDATISTAQTSPAATSRADGSAPGNLTLSSTGSIKVGSGPAVTVDSSHTFANSGTIEVTAENRALGVLVNTGAAGINGNVFDNGTINLPGPASSSPLWPEYVFGTGIEVSGAGTFTGSITRGAGSTLTVGGNGATGIGILTTMNGALINDGAIKVARQDSWGIKALGAISGAVNNGGRIDASGQDAVGIYIGGGVGGAVTNRGGIFTGAAAFNDPQNNQVAAVRGGRALWVASNANGIYLEGNGVTKDLEPTTIIAEGTPGDSDLNVRGNAEALFIGQGGPSGNKAITIGRLAGNANNASVVSRGNIAVETAIKSTTIVRAVNITGASVGGTIFRTTLDGGFRNEGGDITANSRDFTGQGLRIGDYASVPTVFNSGLILGRGVDSGESADGVPGTGGGDAYGIVIEANGRLPEIINTGTIQGDSHGVTFSGYGIVDYSGTLTSLQNDGKIIAARKGAGAAVALDVSRNTTGVTVRNSGSFAGAMNFGSGNDSFTSTGGILLGNMSMGAGNDNVSLSATTLTGSLDLGDGAHNVTLNSSVLEGGLLLGTNGTATLNANASTLSIPTTSGINITNGRISGNSTVNFYIDAQNETVGGIKASGNLIVDAGTTLSTTITGAVVDQFTVNLMEAGSLTLGADLGGLQPGSTVMYRREIRLADTNRNILQYRITRKTAAELGLSSRLGSVYDSVVTGLGQDTEFSGVMANFTEQAKFESALEAMVPDTSDAARRVALTSRRLSQGAIQRRMGGFQTNKNDPLGRFRSGFWLQNVTSFGSGDAEGAVPGYSLFSMGFAAGIDAIMGDQSIIGASLSQTFGSAEEKNRGTEAVKLSTTSLDFYGRANFDAFFVQGTLGYGWNGYKNGRAVAFETIERETKGKSPGYQYSGVVDVGSAVNAGGTVLSGYLRAAYHNIFRHSYEEEGGGPAVDLRYDSTKYTSIRGGVGGSAEHRIQFSTANTLALALRADYAHEFNDDATMVRAKFVGGNILMGTGTTFTIQGATPAKNIISGGIGAAWERRLSVLSLDYDAEKAGGYLGHTVSLTYRQRF